MNRCSISRAVRWAGRSGGDDAAEFGADAEVDSSDITDGAHKKADATEYADDDEAANERCTGDGRSCQLHEERRNGTMGMRPRPRLLLRQRVHLGKAGEAAVTAAMASNERATRCMRCSSTGDAPVGDCGGDDAPEVAPTTSGESVMIASRSCGSRVASGQPAPEAVSWVRLARSASSLGANDSSSSDSGRGRGAVSLPNVGLAEATAVVGQSHNIALGRSAPLRQPLGLLLASNGGGGGVDGHSRRQSVSQMFAATPGQPLMTVPETSESAADLRRADESSAATWEKADGTQAAA
ncbi:hypothetical protein HK405_004622 [Cladochytrium tenue]|nr:hypothetical protein HK405_004622 [Cladochytrium tenue]